MAEVQVRSETTETAVRVGNQGTCRRMGWLYRRSLVIRPGYRFRDDRTTHMSPLHSLYDHSWADPVTGRESLTRCKLFVFFTPAG